MSRPPDVIFLGRICASAGVEPKQNPSHVTFLADGCACFNVGQIGLSRAVQPDSPLLTVNTSSGHRYHQKGPAVTDTTKKDQPIPIQLPSFGVKLADDVMRSALAYLTLPQIAGLRLVSTSFSELIWRQLAMTCSSNSLQPR